MGGTEDWLDLEPMRAAEEAERQKLLEQRRSELDRHYRDVAESARQQALARIAATPPTGERAIVCPHCHVQGRVTRRSVKQKRGVSGGKATGAVLTGGLSLFATGLSRKQRLTELRCGNCGTTWHAD